MTRTTWTAEMIARLRDLYPTHSAAEIAADLGVTLSAVYGKAGLLGLKKPREWVADRARARNADPKHASRATRFAPGIVPWNKGKHHDAGGRSVETRFQPGQMPHTWNPIGHERLTKEGYLQRKVTDTGYTPRDYRPVHHLVWIEHHGEIPQGHAVVFRDGDKTRIQIDNLELVTRAELMRRNTLHRYPKAIARAIQLRGALMRKINAAQGKQP